MSWSQGTGFCSEASLTAVYWLVVDCASRLSGVTSPGATSFCSGTTLGSRSKKYIRAVWPIWSIARWASWTSGRPTWMPSAPTREISGSETPNASTRSRMISIERSMSSGSIVGFCAFGWAW